MCGGESRARVPHGEHSSLPGGVFANEMVPKVPAGKALHEQLLHPSLR